MSNAQVTRVQELRRSSAASPVASKRRPARHRKAAAIRAALAAG